MSDNPVWFHSSLTTSPPVVFLGTLNSSVIVCEFNDNGQLLNGADGCYFLTPVFDWITRCIISIFLVFMIAFLPLFLQGKSRPVFASYLPA